MSRLNTVAIMSPGDMGHGIGRAIGASGRRVITSLAGRRERSRKLAEAGGMEDAGTLDALVAEADIVLSILPPDAALPFAEAVAESLRRTDRRPYFADLNAIAPTTTKRIAEVIGVASAPYIDGGIIGLAPGKAAPTRIYVCGEPAPVMDELAREDMLIRQLGPEIGRASALKMLYAAINKGLNALQAAVLIAGEQYGLTEPLHAELAAQKAMYARMEEWVGFLAADAERCTPEMREIAETMRSAGVTSKFHEGAEEVFAFLATTPLAAETRETWDRSRPLRQSVEIYAEALRKKGT
jgi:3-hydroxyisobutyrate dehydrogenase-like beta-hydroxyacid dehydrogenase